MIEKQWKYWKWLKNNGIHWKSSKKQIGFIENHFQWFPLFFQWFQWIPFLFQWYSMISLRFHRFSMMSICSSMVFNNPHLFFYDIQWFSWDIRRILMVLQWFPMIPMGVWLIFNDFHMFFNGFQCVPFVFHIFYRTSVHQQKDSFVGGGAWFGGGPPPRQNRLPRGTSMRRHRGWSWSARVNSICYDGGYALVLCLWWSLFGSCNFPMECTCMYEQ